MMRYYLAGPMQGRPQFNYPLFDSVSLALRKLGYDIISPAEMDSDEIRMSALASKDGKPGDKTLVADQTWGDFLSRDVKMIADELDAIILLPEWETSKGAKLEAFVSIMVGNPAWTVDPNTMNLRAIVPHKIMEKISASIL